jgi:hypothetical protein
LATVDSDWEILDALLEALDVHWETLDITGKHTLKETGFTLELRTWIVRFDLPSHF